ncbi:hypothetical protein [Pedobacter sp. KBS0701]|uniref:hypothetical protein n=1 Tax=unclassified Pedobacter TaxID=2628915 RepID=UPI00110DC6D2|nr:hypothetical protein [Pedobacter sp. KBS0701]QDW24861.1 hypothetical protein FFJ24_008570 [Pedobacter sp. KBS0701]
MKTILTLFLLITFTQIFGQTGKLYKGTINNTIKITLYLEGLDEGINADPIIGTYKYDNKKNYILLKGFRNNDGNISLVELSTANFSGTFLGTLTKNNIIGKWISANQKKNYIFELTEIVATKEQINNFQKAIVEKGNEFRNY